jgi:hypothetical protein
MKHDRKPEERPMFDSLDEMCEACGFDDTTKEQMRRDMLLTQPHDKVNGETRPTPTKMRRWSLWS